MQLEIKEYEAFLARQIGRRVGINNAVSSARRTSFIHALIIATFSLHSTRCEKQKRMGFLKTPLLVQVWMKVMYVLFRLCRPVACYSSALWVRKKC